MSIVLKICQTSSSWSLSHCRFTTPSTCWGRLVDQAQSSSGIAVAGGDSTRDDTPLFEIAKLCGNNPQALRALASRLSSGFQPDKLIEHLKIPALIPKVLDPGSLAASTAVQDERKDFEDQPMVLSALSITYEETSTGISRRYCWNYPCSRPPSAYNKEPWFWEEINQTRWSMTWRIWGSGVL